MSEQASMISFHVWFLFLKTNQGKYKLFSKHSLRNAYVWLPDIKKPLHMYLQRLLTKQNNLRLFRLNRLLRLAVFMSMKNFLIQT